MRRSLPAAIAAALVIAAPGAAVAGPGWAKRIDRLVRDRNIGVAVAAEGRAVYRHNAYRGRVPASNQKLLLSMAFFDELGPRFRFTTTAAAAIRPRPTLRRNLWILGTGDPSVTGGGAYGRVLPFRPARLGALARRVKGAGVRRIRGRVLGATTYFSHDWWAPGWKPDYRAYEVPLPTALTFEGNVHRGKHTRAPERHAAKSLTKRLEAIGVRVAGRPGAGRPGRGLEPVAAISSAPASTLARHMNRVSSNFFAELFGKRLGVATFGRPGTIHKGARSIRRWAAAHAVDVHAVDSSGLSYSNRVSPRAIVRLLQAARRAPWGPVLRATLPAAGQGTLEDRLAGVAVRAKTGTLNEVSTLSGWVWLGRDRTWAEFSIMSRGMPKHTAVALEDRIVTIVSNRGVPVGARRVATAADAMRSVVDLLLGPLAGAGSVGG